MFKKADYIYCIYAEGSFTKAAEKLYISQPALSAAVKRTEELLGAPLFERTGGVHLTELGVEYIRTAEKILALEQRFADKLKDIHGLAWGTVRVGGSNYISSYILPRIIEVFSGKYPNITISLTEADSGKLMALLEEEKLDLVIDSVDTVPEGSECSLLLEEKILLAVPAALPCNASLGEAFSTPGDIYDDPDLVKALPVVSMEHFKEERFVLLKAGNSMYSHAMDIFRKAGFMPQVSLFLDQLSTSYSLAAQGSGCCFVSDMVFRYHRFEDSVRLYNVDENRYRSLSMVCKKARHITPAQKAFMDTAEEAIKSRC